jgi:hypothetical protein
MNIHFALILGVSSLRAVVKQSILKVIVGDGHLHRPYSYDCIISMFHLIEQLDASRGSGGAVICFFNISISASFTASFFCSVEFSSFNNCIS